MRRGPLTEAELRPYGWQRGKVTRWCACCGKNFRGGSAAFKCLDCALRQAGEVERIIQSTDEENLRFQP